ncbi:hypothetical protein SAMN04488128_103181 [Chitinophaga eiseniae]|uniref:Uncharacterized protein n=1 Tax=Chitinophaga eiseniae TaxID=634771 RepID=A0A1T4SNY4_9BACT|nr:hypothetical protein SAMN04488128_103181 [Chitinophaga eiseniae]
MIQVQWPTKYNGHSKTDAGISEHSLQYGMLILKQIEKYPIAARCRITNL